jgi:3-dehydroquinate dehydratase type I
LSSLPFYVVTLAHGSAEAALACARALPEEALPELRLDLLPGEDPEALVAALGRRCLVCCRRRADGGAWEGDEAGRLERLRRALEGRPAWVDLEWELEPPAWMREARGRTRLLRSVHVAAGVRDLGQRLSSLPEGDAFKWVGVAESLADAAWMKPHLAWARERGLSLSAFLMGPKGLASRCLQRAWGGAFTYAAAEDAPPAAPGQLPLGTLLAWRVHRLTPEYGLCGVLGSPALHSLGPAFHNARFQRAFKDLLYLPLDCGDAEEAAEALEALPVLGASLTMPLKATLPARLGLPGPLNTLWRRHPGAPWEHADTDAIALAAALDDLPRGPVLLLGSGGVAAASARALEALRLPVLQASRRGPATPEAVQAFAPVGVVQATALGMEAEDPAPFPELLGAARPSLRWAAEWVYRRDTAFAAWAEASGLRLVEGQKLFEGQAEEQSRRFTGGCGG